MTSELNRFKVVSNELKMERIAESDEVLQSLTRRLSGFEILNNATLIVRKWLVSRLFANIFLYLIFSEEY